MKRMMGVLVCTFIVGQLFSQSEVLLDIAGDKITLGEFDLVYNKNNASAQAIDPKTKEEYLEMYINFKLKVKEAEDAGMDTAATFVRELEGYRAQLAAPYLTDQNVTDELIKEAYERMKYDVNAYHILINVSTNAAPEDTFKSWLQCQQIKRDLTDPETQFETMAKKHSTDPSAAKNGGNLGYFNVFQMVYPFESAAYNTPVGQISDPVRTRFGYHLLWVKDKRPAYGEIQVAHIMVKLEEGESEESLIKKKQKADEIYKKVMIGEDFAEMAKQYSDDRGSAAKGGELPWFGTGRMVKVFEDASFGLKNNGDVSEPIRTQYGWHIIKRLDKKGTPAYEDIKADLKIKVTRDGRGVKSKKAFYDRVKADYAYKPNWKAINEVATLIDDSYTSHHWKAEEKLTAKPKVICTLTDKKYIKEKLTIDQMELARVIEEDKRYQRKPKVDSTVIVSTLFNELVDKKLLEFENARLEAKYPKFKALTQEYHDGILLFDLMDKKVWTKAVKDSTGLLEFYEKTKADYMWPERADAYVFSCASKLSAQTARSMLEKQIDTGLHLDTIKNAVNKDSQLELTIVEGPFAKGENFYADNHGWKAGLTGFIEENGRWFFVYTKEVMPPQPKKLEEARGLVISAYQEYLEKQWIEELRAKYPVTINAEVLQ